MLLYDLSKSEVYDLFYIDWPTANNFSFKLRWEYLFPVNLELFKVFETI